MKILLICPPIRETSPANSVPLGIGYIASSLREERHNVEVLDINCFRYSKEVVENLIKKSTHGAIGIGALTSQYRYVKWLSSVIKKYKPEIPVFAGNMVATSMPEFLLNRTEIDIAVIDEGENTCKELMYAIEQKKDLKDVKGIYYKDNGKIFSTGDRQRLTSEELEKLPFPAWDLFPMRIYLKRITHWNPLHPEVVKLKAMGISAVRGCPYECNFCSRPFGRKVVSRSSESVIAEIEELKKRYGVGYIGFTDDLFMVHRIWVIKFCEDIIRSKLNILWGATARVNIVADDEGRGAELLKLMRRAGCVWLGYGIESGSQKILDIIGKKVTPEQALKAIDLTWKADIFPAGSFMIGMIGETRKTIKESVAFIKRANLLDDTFFFATPYPNTRLWQQAKDLGRLWVDQEEYILSLGENSDNLLINLTDFSDKELIRLKLKAEKQIRRNRSLFVRYMVFKDQLIRVFTYLKNYGLKKTLKRSIYEFRRHREKIYDKRTLRPR